MNHIFSEFLLPSSIPVTVSHRNLMIKSIKNVMGVNLIFILLVLPLPPA